MKDELATLTEEAILDTSLAAPQNPTWIADLLSDRKRLIEQLSDYIVSPRQELLIQCLSEDKQSRKGKAALPDVLRRIPMSMGEFFEIVKESRRGKSEFRTSQIIDIFRPKITKAVMEGAMPKENTCDKCLGEGSIVKKKEEVVCWKCKGAGIIVVQPEHERQITALKISGVLQKEGAGTVVNVNQAVDASFRSSPEFRRDTDKLMYASTTTVVDVTPEVSPQALPVESATSTSEEISSPLVGSSGVQEKTPAVLVVRPFGKKAEEK